MVLGLLVDEAGDVLRLAVGVGVHGVGPLGPGIDGRGVEVLATTGGTEAGTEVVEVDRVGRREALVGLDVGDVDGLDDGAGLGEVAGREVRARAVVTQLELRLLLRSRSPGPSSTGCGSGIPTAGSPATGRRPRGRSARACRAASGRAPGTADSSAWV